VTSSRNSTRRSSSVPPVRAVSRSRSADPSRRSMGQTQRKSGTTHITCKYFVILHHLHHYLTPFTSYISSPSSTSSLCCIDPQIFCPHFPISSLNTHSLPHPYFHQTSSSYPRTLLRNLDLLWNLRKSDRSRGPIGYNQEFKKTNKH
jgi:hypothetical protein